MAMGRTVFRGDERKGQFKKMGREINIQGPRDKQYITIQYVSVYQTIQYMIIYVSLSLVYQASPNQKHAPSRCLSMSLQSNKQI